MHYVIAHYHELALKGRNRPFLVDRLVRNLREALRGVTHCHVESLAGRIRISLDDPTQWSTIRTRLDAVFGLATFAPAVHASSHLGTMTKAICDSVQGFSCHPYRARTRAHNSKLLARHLSRDPSYSRLYPVPIGDSQRQSVLTAPAPLRVVLYRRLMVRIAEELGHANKCWALVSGDSLGQVASQTAGNLTVVDEAATLPFLRPLIGMDKVEITDQAQKIGTYETSIEPDQDCCRLFTPPNPTTQANLEEVRRAESLLDIHGLAKQAVEKVELREFKFPE